MPAVQQHPQSPPFSAHAHVPVQPGRGSPLSVTPPDSPQAKARKPQGLTFSRGWLVHIAHETVKIAEEGCYTNQKGEKCCVAEALRYSMKNSVHYHSSHNFTGQEIEARQGPPRFEDTEYHIVFGSSLQVATKLSCYLDNTGNTGSIGILNSASGKHPEKFLRGTLSQEEGICRASLLYPCLMQYYNRPHHFYYVNHKPKYQDNSSSCAIFTPKVPVIREDSLQGDLLDHYQTFSIVSIPAPNAFALGENPNVVPKAQPIGASDNNEPYESMTVQSAMYDRIHRALSILALHGCTDLVLCAFGCGVHGNGPRLTAECFCELLQSPALAGRFRTVAFAIHPSRQHNYEQFAQVFLKQQQQSQQQQSQQTTDE